MKRNFGDDVLAACGRRAREELGVPMPDDRPRLNERCGGPDSDQDNHRCHHRNGRSRVHRDAQRAMVGIRVERVCVRHLNQGQQREQGQTHQSRRPESAWLRAVTTADLILQPCQ
ncbi:MAG: hypothetical protein ABSE51_04245 [Terracidiphilus sp.]